MKGERGEKNTTSPSHGTIGWIEMMDNWQAGGGSSTGSVVKWEIYFYNSRNAPKASIPPPHTHTQSEGESAMNQSHGPV